MAVGGGRRGVFQNCKNRTRFYLLFNNQRCYGQMDTTLRFSTLNRSKKTMSTNSNGSWRIQKGVFQNRKNRTCFHLLFNDQPCYGKIDTNVRIVALNRSKNTMSTNSNGS